MTHSSRLSDLQAAQFLIRHEMLPFLTIRNTACRKSVANIDTPLLLLLAEQGQLDLNDVRARLARDASEPPPPPRRRRELDVPRPPPRRHAPAPAAPPAPPRSHAAESEPPPEGAAEREIEGRRDFARLSSLRVAGLVAGLAAVLLVARALWG